MLNKDMVKTLISIKNVCKLLGIDRNTLWRLRSEGKFIKEVKVSPRKVMFFEADLWDWLNR